MRKNNKVKRKQRRSLMKSLGATALFGASLPWSSWAQTMRLDGAGRSVPTVARVQRVFPAGGPAAILLYTLAPDLLLGWPRANRAAELPYLLPEVGRRPELGRLTGRGGTANLERVLALRPDLIVDAGSVRETYVDLANRVQAQTGIPYILLDGRFELIPQTYRLLGQWLNRSKRAETLAAYSENLMAQVKSRLAMVQARQGPRVYYARGPDGLETGLSGSINIELLDWMGLNHFGQRRTGGLARASVEEVLGWNPQVIITIDHQFAESVRRNPVWQRVDAVRNNRVYLSPKMPFGWVDFPPGVNRLPGALWLGRMVYPELFNDDLRQLTQSFYALFYHVEPTMQQVDEVLAGRD